MTIHWKAVEQQFTAMMFVFQLSPVCNFGEFINFGLGTVRSERVNDPHKPLQSSRIISFADDPVIFNRL